MTAAETVFDSDKIKGDSIALIEKVKSLASSADVAGLERDLLMSFTHVEMAKEYLYDCLMHESINLNYFRLISNALFLAGNIVNQAKKSDPDLLLMGKCKDEIGKLMDRLLKYRNFMEKEKSNVSDK